MPKSRKRPHRRSGRAGRARRTPTSRRPAPAELAPYLEAMARADEAERRGDAAGALEIMARMPTGPDGSFFWRPWRVRHLTQIATLGPALPGWVRSRWILEQALQSLDEASRRRASRALDVAIGVRGGASGLPGADPADARAKVSDHDWAYRQVFLYELGGLAGFLRTAPADLVAGADGIADWAATPMSGFQLLDRTPGTVTWAQLPTGERRTTPNIGSSLLVLPGECVIGRLVPIEGGSMFESAPLLVPDAVAERVALDPGSWVDALTAAQREGGEPPVRTGGHRFGLLHDVPPEIWLSVVLDGEPRSRRPTLTGIARATLDLAADELSDPAPDRDPEAVEAWPCLAAAILEPGVGEVLFQVAEPRDEPTLQRLAARLAAPAAGVCGDLARRLREVA